MFVLLAVNNPTTPPDTTLYSGLALPFPSAILCLNSVLCNIGLGTWDCARKC